MDRYEAAQAMRQQILNHGKTAPKFTTHDLRAALGIDIALAQRTCLNMHRLGELFRHNDIGRKACYGAVALVTETAATAKARVTKNKYGKKAENALAHERYKARRTNHNEPWRTIHTACEGESPIPDQNGQGGISSPRMACSMGWA